MMKSKSKLFVLFHSILKKNKIVDDYRLISCITCGREDLGGSCGAVTQQLLYISQVFQAFDFEIKVYKHF